MCTSCLHRLFFEFYLSARDFQRTQKKCQKSSQRLNDTAVRLKDSLGLPFPRGKRSCYCSRPAGGNAKQVKEKKKLKEKTLNMRNKIRQTTHISSVEMKEIDSALGEGKQDK